VFVAAAAGVGAGDLAVQRVALNGNQVDVAEHDAVHVPCAVGQGLDGVAVGAVRVNLHNLPEYEQIRQLARL
jgi:D-serine dehydratase